MGKLIDLPTRDYDFGEPVRIIEFGIVRVVVFFVVALVSSAAWLAGMWQVGKLIWGLP